MKLRKQLLTIFSAAVIGVGGFTLAQEADPVEAAIDADVAAIESRNDVGSAVADPDRSSYQIRSDFQRLLSSSPPELGRLLALDPNLMENEEFLASHPRLRTFLEQNPEVRYASSFYLTDYRPSDRSGVDRMISNLVEMLLILAFIGGVIWLIRTIVEQRRWSRLSKTQTEVHNKILDRFGTTQELIDYMGTKAGQRFLESAPIPVRSETEEVGAPWNRILWAIQIGIVVASGGLAIALVSARYEAGDADALFTMGSIGIGIGVGFVLSAIVSYILSRRMGLIGEGERDRNEIGTVA